MKFRIVLGGQEIHLGNGELHFTGYINHNKHLLYDEQAAGVLNGILESQSVEMLLSGINGAFRLIYRKDDTIYFSVDHFGGFSLFYTIGKDCFEILDNPLYSVHKGDLDDVQICSLMAAGFTIGEGTFFENIRECLPGTLYKYDSGSGKLESQKWFEYLSTNEKTLDAEELLSIAETLFPETDNGQYTLSLSGGIDSRFLLGCLLQKSRPFQTFSFGAEYNQDKHLAAILAKEYGFPNQQHSFTPDLCKDYYGKDDLDFIIRHCSIGRSLPNETDLISSALLNHSQNIIVKGFGGDWLTGRYITPALHKIESTAQMNRYLFDKYFGLTCRSSKAFTNAIREQFEVSLNRDYYPKHPSLISAAEQWNQHHNERKYIINTLACYKAASLRHKPQSGSANFRFYLPFYDRNLMHYFSQVRFSEKTDQNGYFRFLRDSFFTGKLTKLKELPTLRRNFLAPVKPSLRQTGKDLMHSIIRNMDRQKIRKKYVKPHLAEYADFLMLFNHNIELKPFLRRSIGENYPEAEAVAVFLREADCFEASDHVKWLISQQTAQINLNGLSLCKFFFNDLFISYLREHLT
ncbi:MAG: hypothetical protein FJ041_00610 [Candidatus Cloacimonetes bacterium]|nr:hypothetical protein [Candidatus Cloacimonadota bacterium]